LGSENEPKYLSEEFAHTKYSNDLFNLSKYDQFYSESEAMMNQVYMTQYRNPDMFNYHPSIEDCQIREFLYQSDVNVHMVRVENRLSDLNGFNQFDFYCLSMQITQRMKQNAETQFRRGRLIYTRSGIFGSCYSEKL
jgi:hypothetical protein